MTTPSLGPFPGADHDRAAVLDASDPLARFRSRYVVADPELIYLDGNSLGRLPHRAADLVRNVVDDEWGDRLIRSWNEGWWDLQVELGDRLAPIVGASSGEVIISDSTSVNLYKLAAAAIGARPGRTKVISDDLNFPTDVYVLRGLAESEGRTLEIIESDGTHGPIEEIEAAIDDDTALVSLSHTTFKSGFVYDLNRLTAAAHRHGSLVLWDLSHSVGAVPVDLDGAGADLAVGCTYKYMNGGPGAPAFLYVRKDLQGSLTNPIAAWWGHAEPFAFDLEFRPVEGMRRFHTGTMPIISLAAIQAGIDDVAEATVGSLREKSSSLTGFLVEQCDRHLAELGFEVASPRDPEVRGSHVSLSHPDAWSIARAMVDVGKVIPDFRAPDNLRLGLAPLYTTHLEVHTAVQRIKRLFDDRVHLEPREAPGTVT